MSKWLVGSSKSSSVGWMNSARARAIRMRQPPLNSFVFFCCLAGVKPRPHKMVEALASAVVASISSRRSYTCVSLSMSSSWPSASSSSILSFRSSASCSRAFLSTSTLMTASLAVMSVASISSLRWKISIPSGIGKHLAATTRMNTDLPHPLRPMNPYLLP
mmetsp:Transcript_24572/g.41570  ORF Transcript_24572/g.41570 Transcript_24572/m.41570 type:complete len:161 (+) Transcript_24572:443-925(+)